MFEETRIRFNSYVFPILNIDVLRYPIFMNVTLPFWFYRKLLWSKEERYPDSLSEFGDLTKPGRFFFYFVLRFTHLLFFEERLTTFAQWTQKADKEFYKLLRFLWILISLTLKFRNLGGQVLNRVPFYKYLGIYLEPSLSFKEHVTRLNNKISSQLGLLSRVRNNLNGLCSWKSLNSHDTFQVRLLRFCLEQLSSF